jgi:hypothetical protein
MAVTSQAELVKTPELEKPEGTFRPRLLGTLVMKEVHDLALTMRFSVGTVIAVALAILAAYVGSLDYNARLESYQTKIRLNKHDVERTTVYSFLAPTLVRPPEPLSILNHGLEGRVGTDFGISVDTENTEAVGENRGNEYLAVFSEVDLSVIVGVILGLLALLFTFDAVCGEREGGTLKLAMSYALPRWQLLLGKYLGAWITLMLPTVLACLLSLAVVGWAARVNLGVAEFGRIALLFLGYGLYLSLMLLVGLVISCFAQRSSLALVFAAFFWFFFVVIVPNLATMVPDFVGDRASVYQRARQGLRDTDREQEGLVKEIKDPRLDMSVGFYLAINNSSGSYTQYECRWGDRKYYEMLVASFSKIIPLSLRMASKRAEIWREYIRYRERQASQARVLSFFSPTSVLVNTDGYLSGTSPADYQRYIALASQYRKTFLDYLARKNAFSSYRWFTEDPPDEDRCWTTLLLGKTADEMTASGAKLEETINGVLNDPETFKKAAQFDTEAQKSPGWTLSLNDVPQFTYTRMRAGQVLVTAAPEILYLLVLNLVLFLVAFVRFVRYDVR